MYAISATRPIAKTGLTGGKNYQKNLYYVKRSLPEERIDCSTHIRCKRCAAYRGDRTLSCSCLARPIAKTGLRLKLFVSSTAHREDRT